MANLYNVPLKNAVLHTLAGTLTQAETATITLDSSVASELQASSTMKGTLVIDRVDVNGNLTPTKTEYIAFTGVSGSTVTGLTRGLAGTSAQGHSIGAIVEFVPDVTWAQAINDVFTTQHNDDGTHKTISGISLVSVTLNNSAGNFNSLSLTGGSLASLTLGNTVIIGASLASVTITNYTLGGGGLSSQAITNSTLDAFTFNSGFSNMSNATQGNLIAFNLGKVSPITNGTLNQTLLMASTASGLLPTFGSNVFNQVERQGSNATTYTSGGSINYLETGVYMQMGAIDCVGMTTSGSTKAITFPKAFSQTPLVWITFFDATNAHFGVIGNVRSITTTGFTIINNSTINSGSIYEWFAIGK